MIPADDEQSLIDTRMSLPILPSAPLGTVPAVSAAWEQLVSSRRQWIETVLEPWCRSAGRRDLLLAEAEWTNLAGQVDPQATLWKWAWSRFAELGTEQWAIDESSAVTVVTHRGDCITGYPDGRASRQGQLVLLIDNSESPGQGFDRHAVLLDDICSITRHGMTAPPAVPS
jgi:hypothetical protein